MKIKWKKTAPRVASGYVGKICCFEIEKYKHDVLLICELPNVTDHIYGRSIVKCSSSKEAAKRAETTLKHWIKRLKDNE